MSNTLLTNSNNSKMKKLLLVLAIGGFVACSDNAANTENAAGDTGTTVESSLDTSAMGAPDTSASASVDTLGAGAATGTDTLRK
jgi:hypothetical protein